MVDRTSRQTTILDLTVSYVISCGYSIDKLVGSETRVTCADGFFPRSFSLFTFSLVSARQPIVSLFAGDFSTAGYLMVFGHDTPFERIAKSYLSLSAASRKKDVFLTRSRAGEFRRRGSRDRTTTPSAGFPPGRPRVILSPRHSARHVGFDGRFAWAHVANPDVVQSEKWEKKKKPF